MRNSWSDTEKENLYHIGISLYRKFHSYRSMTSDSGLVGEIHGKHAKPDRDRRSILYKLAEMGFLRQGPRTHATGEFFSIRFTERDLLNFRIRPKYSALSAPLKAQIATDARRMALECGEIEQLCQRIGSPIGMSDLRVKIELYDQKIIALNPLLKHELTIPHKKGTHGMNIASKRIPDDLKQRINANRQSIAWIYDSYRHDNPAFVSSNDGTGTGKSYSVFDQYLRKTDASVRGEGHRNLLFVTPLKSQIAIDAEHLALAKTKDIPILCILAQGDMGNIEFKDWIHKEKNEKKFKRWCTDAKGPLLAADLRKLRSQVDGSRHCLQEISLTVDLEYKKELEKQLLHYRRSIHATLLRLTQSIITQKDANGNFVAPAVVFAGTSKRDQAFAEILDFVVPFERAKLRPCILVATSDKFNRSTQDVRSGRNGPTLRAMDFDFIVGQKIPGNRLVTAYNARPPQEQMEFLRDQFFVPDPASAFAVNTIAFTVIIDEEHVAYDKFFDQSKDNLFDTNQQVAHIFSVIHRIRQTLQGNIDEEVKRSFVLYEEHKGFYDDLDRYYSTRCTISSNRSLDQILEIFSNNVRHIVIDSSEVEQVISICRNVFSITPKRYFNENTLKKIRIGSFGNNTECRIYYETTENDPNPSMHDILQVLLCVFAACSQITSDDFRKLLQHGDENSHNSLLDKFISKSINARVNVNAMFDRANDPNLYIDEFFTYFTPKLIFSIEKVNDLEFFAAELQDKVYVSFRLDLFEELPEVSLMRMMHGTRNTITTLSATCGYHNNFSGNYSRPTLQNYGSQMPLNLDFRSIRRTQADARNLQNLRDSRAECRTVHIHEFEDSQRDRISKEHLNPDFASVYKRWVKQLEPFFRYRDLYTTSEYKRQIEAFLLAAFHRKNTFILSRSGRLLDVFKAYFNSAAGQALRGLKILLSESHKIFEITPFDQGVTLRVILYNADLAKQVDINTYLELTDDETKIAFISPFRSAGTGLNLFVKYPAEDIREDFERLVIINSPHYSAIYQGEGLNTVENYVLLLKHYAASRVSVQVKDFDVNLTDSENYRILMQEHQLALLKEILQAIGRVERCDTFLESEIFLPSDVIDLVAMQLHRLKEDPHDNSIQNLSLLNHRLLEFCESRIERSSFTEDQRSGFEDRVRDDFREIERFFSEYLAKRLGDARQGDFSAVALNEAVRSVDFVRNTAAWIERLLGLPEVESNPYLQSVIQRFFIILKGSHAGVRLCRKNGDAFALTDMTGGDALYRPYEQILPRYVQALKGSDETVNSILRSVMSLEHELNPSYIPHPALLPLFKGNVGEYLFSQVLSHLDISYLTASQVFSDLSAKAYELFDFYIRRQDRLYCIDVKNWSTYFDKTKLSLETHAKALHKREALIALGRDLGFTPRFIYLNTHPNINAINNKQEFDNHEPIHYMNLFKTVSQYKENEKKHKWQPRTSLYERLEINASLVNMLTKGLLCLKSKE